jgi:MFS transporter, PPP family, 3-phenylpropionic acid transporter
LNAVTPIRAVMFTYFAYAGLSGTFITLYADSLTYTALQIGWIVAAQQALRIVAPNFWAHLADATGQRKRVMLGTICAAAAAFAAFLVVRDFWLFLLTLVIVQVFQAAQAPLAEAAAVDALAGDMSRYGRIRLWGSVGFIIAVTAAGPLFEHAGIGWWPAVSLALLLLTAVAIARLPALPAASHAQAGKKTPSFLAQLKRRDVALFFASAFFLVGAHGALYAFFSLYLHQAGYSKTWIGVLWAIGVIFEVGVFYWQRHWIGRRSLYFWLTASIAVAVLRFALIALFVQSLAVLLFAQALHAITFAVHHSASLSIMQRWFAGPMQARGQAVFFSVAYGLGCSVAALGAGWIWEKVTPSAVFWAASIGSVLAAVCAVGSLREHARVEALVTR